MKGAGDEFYRGQVSCLHTSFVIFFHIHVSVGRTLECVGSFYFYFFHYMSTLPTWFNSSISMCSQSSVTCALSFALSCEDENCKLHISCSHSYTRVPFRDLFGYVNQFMNNRQRRCKTYPVCLLLRHHNF